MKEGDVVTIGGLEWDVICTYTRAQAIEDGYLVDVTETAKEAGIRYPVALTRAVWDGIITPDPRAVKWGQDEAGRMLTNTFRHRVRKRRTQEKADTQGQLLEPADKGCFRLVPQERDKDCVLFHDRPPR